MKYKLVNKESGKEFVCDKIGIGDNLYYTIPVTNIIPKGERYIAQNTLSEKDVIGVAEILGMKFYESFVKRIVATDNLELDFPRFENFVITSYEVDYS